MTEAELIKMAHKYLDTSGDRCVEHGDTCVMDGFKAGHRDRDEEVAKLREALKEIASLDWEGPDHWNIARKALEGK